MRKTTVFKHKIFLLFIFFCLFISFSSTASALTKAEFKSAIQRGESSDPGLIPLLEERFVPLAQALLPKHKISSVKIDRNTGEILVKGTDANGKPVTVKGTDVGGNPDALGGILEWIRCTWKWFTGLGTPCKKATQETPIENPNYDNAEERQKRAAANVMMYG